MSESTFFLCLYATVNLDLAIEMQSTQREQERSVWGGYKTKSERFGEMSSSMDCLVIQLYFHQSKQHKAI